jgi:hypothetical protein
MPFRSQGKLLQLLSLKGIIVLTNLVKVTGDTNATLAQLVERYLAKV